MIGHITGIGAQLATVLFCKSLKGNDFFCHALGIVIHEAVIEPTVNTLALEGLSAFMDGKFQLPDFTAPKLLFGSIGSILFSLASHSITNHNHNCEHHHSIVSKEMIIDGVSGLIGSYAGVGYIIIFILMIIMNAYTMKFIMRLVNNDLAACHQP